MLRAIQITWSFEGSLHIAAVTVKDRFGKDCFLGVKSPTWTQLFQHSIVISYQILSPLDFGLAQKHYSLKESPNS